jgi:hypothetical protein
VPKGLLLVFSQPVSADRETEYNDWYDDVHLHDLVAVEGVVSAARYKVAEAQLGGGGPDGPPYLAVYEIEADDPGRVLEAIREGGANGAFRMSDAIDGASADAFFVEQITEAVTEATAAAASSS